MVNEKVYSSQFTAAYEDDGPWSVKSWAYMNIRDETVQRYDDRTYSTISDPMVNGTFDLDNNTRILGLHSQASYEHDWGGQLSFVIDARQEHFGERVDQAGRERSLHREEVDA